jgi:hypothetical protein
VTNAQLERALLALTERVAAIEKRHADEDAEREAAAERRRRQQLRDELAAHRARPLELVDVEQAARSARQVDRAVDRFRKKPA